MKWHTMRETKWKNECRKHREKFGTMGTDEKKDEMAYDEGIKTDKLGQKTKREKNKRKRQNSKESRTEKKGTGDKTKKCMELGAKYEKRKRYNGTDEEKYEMAYDE